MIVVGVFKKIRIYIFFVIIIFVVGVIQNIRIYIFFLVIFVCVIK